ncbi:S41 family peptidase [Pedobacter paludis]|uniref:Tail specific protease domain-containing protein n=1 Tax=Pedobacter paludis TaxID=2203212 RepID=A0A317F5V0_9SPHI|nr:S41 family peptidase [Pedobacter paludis]PWS33279.1 hypothetical protein DF947_01245 [Pedobacter paludis]
MFRKSIPILFAILNGVVLLSCSQNNIKKATAKEDISFMVSVLKSSLTQQYFDKKKATDLVQKLTEMEQQKMFEGVSDSAATEMVTNMLRKETNDKHFNVIAYPKIPSIQNDKPQPKLSSAGISRFKILKNNIGYIKWDLCIANEDAFKEIRRVLDSLSGCDKLIFDISENPGGDGASSAFINQFLYRDKSYQTLLKKKCTGEQDWKQSEVIFNYTNGPTFFDNPIYIITSDKTFSAAEYFAFTAKELKRATIIGKTTAGAGNPGSSVSVALPNSDMFFWMFIPNCQIVTRDGHSIKGIGVKPDVTLKGVNLLNETLEYVLK